MSKELSTLGSVIKTAYEAEADTNAYTDAEKTKLAGVEAAATADQTGAEIKTAYEGEADTNALTDARVALLDAAVQPGDNVSGLTNDAGYTDDQTDAEIAAAYQTAVPLIAQGDAEAGIATDIESWSALRVKQAIDALGGGGGIGSLVEDTSPQLGGTLDMNGQSLSHTLNAATGDEVGYDLALTVDKLTSGNYTLLKGNVTETSAPGAADLLVDLQVGGVNKHKVDNAGNVTMPAGAALISNETGGRALDFTAGGYADFNRVAIGSRGSGGPVLGQAAEVGWSDNTLPQAGTVDLTLYRDAAGALAQRNGTNPQKCKWYGDYAGATDYQRSGIVTSRTATTVPAAASFTLSGFIPAGALLIGITSRVDTECTTATGYTVGDGSDVDLWGVAAAVAVGTATGSADFTAAGASGVFFSAAQDVVVTAVGGNFDGTGVITLCGHFLMTEAD